MLLDILVYGYSGLFPIDSDVLRLRWIATTLEILEHMTSDVDVFHSAVVFADVDLSPRSVVRV